MLRLAVVAVGAALALVGSAHAQRPPTSSSTTAMTCAAPRFEASTAVSRTAAALLAALDQRELTDRGRVWMGKLGSVGGGRRDTVVWTPDALDAARPIEVIVYFEGHGSFADDAMDHRHAAAIGRLAASGGNVAYVAPDAPSSSHGARAAKTPYWQVGCATERCAGGHAAPGDFIAFVRDARARIASQRCVAPAALDLRLHLIGFSNGGKGIVGALAQLAAVDFAVDDRRIALGDVIFADGNYGAAWLAEAWAAIAARPEAPRLTILLREAGADGNRRRAASFRRTIGAGDAPRLRLVPLPLSHHGVGDAAIDYVQLAGE